MRLEAYQPTLNAIAAQHERMVNLTMRWAEINSHSENLEGLARMSLVLQEAFGRLPHTALTEIALEPQKRLDIQGQRIDIPLGKALVIRKDAPDPQRRVLLSGHMDTVYPPESHFQHCQRINANRLVGPGVADLKGGLVVLLTALEAFEGSPYAQGLSWEVLINPDEEIGSTGSGPLLRASARRHDVGLVFEPALPDGAFVSGRKGSATYTLISRGRAAHAGRDFALGRNAMIPLLPVMDKLIRITDLAEGTTLNLGALHAGGSANIVPDLARLQFGLRANTPEALRRAQQRIEEIIAEHKQASELQLLQISARPPKLFNAATERFYQSIGAYANLLGISMRWQDSGGVCDGNLLATEGLLTIDTLGPIGGHLHTPQEYVQLDSLVPRTQLATLILMGLATDSLGT